MTLVFLTFAEHRIFAPRNIVIKISVEIWETRRNWGKLVVASGELGETVKSFSAYD